MPHPRFLGWVFPLTLALALNVKIDHYDLPTPLKRYPAIGWSTLDFQIDSLCASYYQIVLISLQALILESLVISAMPSAKAVAPMSRSHGSPG